MDLPSIATPKTPVTPNSPADITVHRISAPEEIVSFSDCQALARAVKVCSRSLVEGDWVDITDIRGRKPRFIPSNFESAKAFLRSSVEQISPAILAIQSTSVTPVTSHPRPSMAICHACHGPIGGGAHTGSALGKGICSHQHSHFCKGGIVENQTWAPCPEGYIYNQDLDLASGPGFESTLQTFNFQAGNQDIGPSSSTPAAHDGVVSGMQQGSQTILPPFTAEVDQNPLDQEYSTVDRFPGVGERRQLSREFPADPDTRIPSRVSMDMGAAGGESPAHHGHVISENVQNNIEEHRAANQNERLVPDRPMGDVNITDLRNDPLLKNGVEQLIEDVRQRIPSLSAAPSITAPSSLTIV